VVVVEDEAVLDVVLTVLAVDAVDDDVVEVVLVVVVVPEPSGGLYPVGGLYEKSCSPKLIVTFAVLKLKPCHGHHPSSGSNVLAGLVPATGSPEFWYTPFLEKNTLPLSKSSATPITSLVV